MPTPPRVEKMASTTTSDAQVSRFKAKNHLTMLTIPLFTGSHPDGNRLVMATPARARIKVNKANNSPSKTSRIGSHIPNAHKPENPVARQSPNRQYNQVRYLISFTRKLVSTKLSQIPQFHHVTGPMAHRLTSPEEVGRRSAMQHPAVITIYNVSLQKVGSQAHLANINLNISPNIGSPLDTRSKPCWTLMPYTPILIVPKTCYIVTHHIAGEGGNQNRSKCKVSQPIPPIISPYKTKCLNTK